MAVADEDSAVASDVQTEGSPAGVGDDDGLAALGWNPHDALVLHTRPQLAGRVNDDILGPVSWERDDGNARCWHVRQRVDRWGCRRTGSTRGLRAMPTTLEPLLVFWVAASAPWPSPRLEPLLVFGVAASAPWLRHG